MSIARSAEAKEAKNIISKLLKQSKVDQFSAKDWATVRGDNPLEVAVRNGLNAQVTALISRGAQVNVICQEPPSETALRSAVQWNRSDLVEVLLTAKADPSFREREKGAPNILSLAADKKVSPAIVNSLVAAKAHPNAQNPASGRTALMVAISNGSVGLVRALLENAANPNVEDRNGETAIHVACAVGNEDAVGLLMEYGADGKHPDHGKRLPASKVPSSKKRVIAPLLLQSHPVKPPLFQARTIGTDSAPPLHSEEPAVGSVVEEVKKPKKPPSSCCTIS